MFWKLTALSASSPRRQLIHVAVQYLLELGCQFLVNCNPYSGLQLKSIQFSVLPVKVWSFSSLVISSDNFVEVEAVLDKENFTLEELLDEEEIIQECKALNSRLINLYSLLKRFLRDRSQVEQLLHYIVEDPPEDADSKRTFKFPFIACEIFTCEIDVILKTLVEEEELMDLLFSFLEPNRSHSALLAGYFSKVVVCLMLRKTISLMNYVKVHQDVFKQLVDLIGITSIMESWLSLQLLFLTSLRSFSSSFYQVLVRLLGADEHLYPNSFDVMQWLADSNLLEMIVDKLNTSNPPEVHANAAETLCSITRNAPSPVAMKLSSPSFVERVFSHALEDSPSKSALVHSLSVCISLLDPKRSISSSVMYSFRSQHVYEPPAHVNPDTIGAMLPKLGELLMLLNVTSDEKVLPTTYGELRPPLGQFRLKIVEFLAVLLKTGNEVAGMELVGSGTIQRVLDLFFEYPYNNALHHHVESIIYSCLESKNSAIVDHLLLECNLVGRILQSDRSPDLSDEINLPTKPASGKHAPRGGYFGHLTRIANKLVQLGNSVVQTHLQENSEWNEWRTTVLQERSTIENVYRWACGRPTALQDRTRDSDEEDAHDRDYDVAALANNLSQAFRYNIYDNDDNEGHGSLDRDDEDVYFDDESAEVVISSLRLGGDQGSLFTNSNWFAFQDDRISGNPPIATSSSEMLDGLKPSVTKNPFDDLDSADLSLESQDNGPFGARPAPTWVAWGNEPNVNPFDDPNIKIESDDVQLGLSNGMSSSESSSSDGSVKSNSSHHKNVAVPSLFEEDVEFVGVELEGTEKAMEQALKEGIVGEAGPLKRNLSPKKPESETPPETGAGMEEFNDANYWRVDQELTVLE
ncbi:SIT4 phosphatase-associated family protein [Striga asiatica]|uniref:SIT4 phosphatase-associated family protein n=1 Tax=Striga asiatica TaxID=4170 RepID=A0A5A7PKB6_STRAF|nr:SIT4 phosphatase-associated family protein [Striga asiatica]